MDFCPLSGPVGNDPVRRRERASPWRKRGCDLSRRPGSLQSTCLGVVLSELIFNIYFFYFIFFLFVVDFVLH